MDTDLGQEEIQLKRMESAQETAKKKIMQYFNMLTKGCGSNACTNDNCATFKRSHNMVESIPEPNAAARTAIELLRNQVPLCSLESSGSGDLSQCEPSVPSGGLISHPPTSSDFTPVDCSSSSSSLLGQHEGMEPAESSPQLDTVEIEIDDMDTSSAKRAKVDRGEDHDEDKEEEEEHKPLVEVHSVGALATHQSEPESGSILDHGNGEGASEMIVSEFVTEFDFEQWIEEGKNSNPPNYNKLNENIFKVFSFVGSMNHSFLLPQEKKTESSSSITIDVDSARRVFSLLDSLEDESVSSGLMTALIYYSKEACLSTRYSINDSTLNQVVAMLHNPLLLNPDYLENVVPDFFHAVACVSFEQQVQLVEWHSHCSKERLGELLELVQQFIAFTIAISASDNYDIHFSLPMAAAVRVLQMLYFANLCAARNTSKVRPRGELQDYFRQQRVKRRGLGSLYERMLYHFEIHPGEVLDPPLSLDLFLNEEFNDRFLIRRDVANRQAGTFNFSNYPCCLDPVNKVAELQADNLRQMAREEMISRINEGGEGFLQTHLDLQVDRNNLIQDTLMQLEIYTKDRPSDIRKRLCIHFQGEEGLDEGGVQKEFFQVIIAELFKPEYAMFVVDEETGNCWPNGYSYESEREYMLIGILFGLAIYNNVILDVRFPMVLYYKLLGFGLVNNDLFSSHPTIARSLEGTLQYQGDDFEQVFNLTFSVSQTDMFGAMHTHMLKPVGDSVPVTMDNRQEYVDLYTDWLLSKSIETQFHHFKEGFHKVVEGTSLMNLLRPEELEQLVCGLKDWDFEELKNSALYDSGYSPEHEVIKKFWDVVNEFDENQKKALLQFVTGTDRVPLGGLSRLHFTIVRHGCDSDQLPISHTCFNILLLPPYATKEKLRDRLLKAITHGNKGFAML